MSSRFRIFPAQLLKAWVVKTVVAKCRLEVEELTHLPIAIADLRPFAEDFPNPRAHLATPRAAVAYEADAEGSQECPGFTPHCWRERLINCAFGPIPSG